MIDRQFLATFALVAGFLSPAHGQQQTRTTCYMAGNDRICDTYDTMGNPIGKTRCYRTGRDWRCDSSGAAPPTPFPVR